MVKDHTDLLLDFTSAAEWLWTSDCLVGASTAVFSKIFKNVPRAQRGNNAHEMFSIAWLI